MSEIQDPRFKIWDLSFVIFGSRHDIFVVQSSRFEIFLGNQCALSDSISLFCIFLCHMNISCSCWFFFTCPNAGRDEGELFQLLWWRAVPGGKGNGDSKTDAQKTGINNFIPCYIVSLCYQQKGFVPCWANKKNVLPVVAKFCSTSCEGKGLWRRICSTHHSQEWEEGGAEERDTQGKKEGPHWGETVLERNWNTSETIIWC